MDDEDRGYGRETDAFLFGGDGTDDHDDSSAEHCVMNITAPDKESANFLIRALSRAGLGATVQWGPREQISGNAVEVVMRIPVDHIVPGRRLSKPASPGYGSPFGQIHGMHGVLGGGNVALDDKDMMKAMGWPPSWVSEPMSQRLTDRLDGVIRNASPDLHDDDASVAEFANRKNGDWQQDVSDGIQDTRPVMMTPARNGRRGAIMLVHDDSADGSRAAQVAANRKMLNAKLRLEGKSAIQALMETAPNAGIDEIEEALAAELSDL